MSLLAALAGEAFCRVADAQASEGNRIRLLRDAAETYPAWLEAIGQAEFYVHLENYILQEDEAGAQFTEALLAVAARGVKCRVLYDWLGCATRTSGKFWTRLRDAGVEVRRYNPPKPSSPFAWISRDHRKVVCVDGRVAYTGGLCIGHDWIGRPGVAPWRDTAIEIFGPAVAHIDAAFADSWAQTGTALEAGASAGSPAEANGGVEVSVIAGRPNHMSLYRLEQLIAEIVSDKLWLSDGYFVATTGYVKALSGAARAGVDVRLLVPGSSNWPVVGALSQSAFRPLLTAGVRVFEWNGPMLHAKTAVADGCWTRIGSSNSNLASWVSNRELDVTVKDATLAGQMEAMFEDDMKNATEVVLRRGRSGLRRPASAGQAPHKRRPKVSASRLVSGAIGFGNTLGASFNRRRQLGPAEALVLLGGGAMLMVLGLVAVFLPRVIAWPLGLTALWVAIGFLVSSLKLWRAGRQGDKKS